MTTNVRPLIDLWIDDDELEELATSLDRIVNRRETAPAAHRTTFYADYYDAE